MALMNLGIIFADASTTATPVNPTGQMVQMVVTFGLFGVMFYFLFIRPQSKKAKEHATLLQSVKAGDKIVTSSGIIGQVITVKDKSLTLRSADTKLEISKSAIAEISERSGEVTES
jgi:preprotein translocase subunit YajC